jgi:hypothetical protein
VEQVVAKLPAKPLYYCNNNRKMFEYIHYLGLINVEQVVAELPAKPLYYCNNNRKMFEHIHYLGLINDSESLNIFRKRVATDPKFCYCSIRNDKGSVKIFKHFHHYALIGDTEALNLFRERVVATDPKF